MPVDHTPDPVVLFLPARNEAATVAEVVGAAPRLVEVAGRQFPVRVVVVDDGSTDGTAGIAAAAGADVVRTPGLGLGAAVQVGLATAVAHGAAAVAFCDADREYDPTELPRLVEPILRGRADYVIGSRFLGGPRHMRPHRYVGNRLLTVLVAALTRGQRTERMTDGQSGFRALSGAAASCAEIAHDYNYAQVLTLDLVAKGFRYAEVPITYRRRQVGRSYVRLPTYLRRVIPAMWRTRRRRVSAQGPVRASAGLASVRHPSPRPERLTP